MMRAATYSRQSMDKTKSINEQASENRADAEGEGWQVVAEYSDGTSASRFARKGRDDWQRVLADINTRAWDVLVLWESSRGDRTPESWLSMLARCREQQVLIRVKTHGRTYDIRNPRDWRTLAEDGIDSAYESEKTSQRARRGIAGAAAAGRPSHGRCPYGHRRTYDPRTGALVGQEPNPDVAPVVREIIERVARSEPISAVTDDLNGRGIPAPSGGRWLRKVVRDVALNPAHAGRRVLNEQLYPGGWPALVDDMTWYAARRVLTESSRTTTRPGRQVHLLSYLATCEPCGDQLAAAKGRYRCPGRGCVAVSQVDADDFVADAILARVTRGDIYGSLRQAGDDADRAVIEAREESAKLRAQLDGWRRSAARGQTSPESLAVIEGELSAQIRAADGRGKTAAIPPALRQILAPGTDVATRWKGMSVAARRNVIRSLAVITVGRAEGLGGQRPFTPQRLAGSRWVGDEKTWGEHWAA